MSVAPLSNVEMYHKSVIEHKEIKQKIPGKVGKELMWPSSSPYNSPIILAHKKNGTWEISVDFNVDSFKQKNFMALIDH